MRYTLLDGKKDATILVARILLMLLFVISGWSKLISFAATITYMNETGLPFPVVASIVAIIMELPAGLLIFIGFYTRPVALILAIYTIATAIIGHHFWTMHGDDRIANMVSFYKNAGMAGGFLLMCLTGPGKYSIDRT